MIMYKAANSTRLTLRFSDKWDSGLQNLTVSFYKCKKLLNRLSPNAKIIMSVEKYLINKRKFGFLF